jgi:hypothetical protein
VGSIQRQESGVIGAATGAYSPSPAYTNHAVRRYCSQKSIADRYPAAQVLDPNPVVQVVDPNPAVQVLDPNPVVQVLDPNPAVQVLGPSQVVPSVRHHHH